MDMIMEAQHWERKRSIWQLTADPLEFAKLSADTSADACVIGAGIAGLSVAYELACAGLAVVVIDDGAIGAGMTGRTTAHLSNALDDRYYNIEKLLGRKNAQLAAESHTAAIKRIEEIVKSEQFDCEFERLDGYLFNPPGESRDILKREFEAACRAGLTVHQVGRAPFGDFNTGPALRFPDQAQFHPLKYLAGLAHAIQHKGGRIFTGTHVRDMKSGETATAVTDAGAAIKAGHIVVATNVPFNDRFVIHTKQAPYTTYAIGIRVPKGSVHRALFWDTAQRADMQDQTGPIPYHYVRIQGEGDHDILIVGGEDHKTAQSHADAEAPFRALENWTRARVASAGELEYRWSGQVMEPIDGMAFIGRNPADAQNVYVVTGDSGNGMTHGALAGVLIRDLILGHENAWASLYDPSRKTLKAASEFLHENINVAAQMREYVTGGDLPSTDEIQAGTGAIVREGLSKVAAYRDESGTLHRFSAVCPHLKCIVQWNPTEKTWDCPCHGSRFDAFGAVITGPANRDLDPA